VILKVIEDITAKAIATIFLCIFYY
jgi:hypothetical protein